MRIHFILVEPAVPENVGAAARAIKTMGFQYMRLVNPCDYLSDPARWLAHGSNDVLETAKVFQNLKEAVADLDLVIGTTANTKRAAKQDFHTSNELAEILKRKKGQVAEVGLVFGREESGLSNEELQLCDLATSVPLAASYPSINLAQAVMVYSYALSSLNLKEEMPVESDSNKAQFKALKEKVEQLLEITEINKNSVKANRIKERLALVGQTDLNLLHTVCSALLDKLKK